jgi:hypothetical protein
MTAVVEWYIFLVIKNMAANPNPVGICENIYTGNEEMKKTSRQ